MDIQKNFAEVEQEFLAEYVFETDINVVIERSEDFINELIDKKTH